MFQRMVAVQKQSQWLLAFPQSRPTGDNVHFQTIIINCEVVNCQLPFVVNRSFFSMRSVQYRLQIKCNCNEVTVINRALFVSCLDSHRFIFSSFVFFPSTLCAFFVLIISIVISIANAALIFFGLKHLSLNSSKKRRDICDEFAVEFSSGFSHTCPAALRLSASTINSLRRVLCRAVCHKVQSLGRHNSSCIRRTLAS